MSKFLITTGWNYDGYQRDSRMLDLSIKGGSNCKDWAELPKDVDSATGGVIQDVVVICGVQFLQVASPRLLMSATA